MGCTHPEELERPACDRSAAGWAELVEQVPGGTVACPKLVERLVDNLCHHTHESTIKFYHYHYTVLELAVANRRHSSIIIILWESTNGSGMMSFLYVGTS